MKRISEGRCISMQNRIRTDAARTTMVCVDRFENSVPKGRFYNYGNPDEGQVFHGLMDLLVGIENILDATDYGLPTKEARTFSTASIFEVYSSLVIT